MTEPAGMTTRSPCLRSTIVVASKRSSTCAVRELNGCCRRTSSSVPTGTSAVDADRPSPVRGCDTRVPLSAAGVPAGGGKPPPPPPPAPQRDVSNPCPPAPHSPLAPGSVLLHLPLTVTRSLP